MNRFKVRDQKSRSLVYKYVDAIMCCVDAHLFYILEPTGNTEKRQRINLPESCK